MRKRSKYRPREVNRNAHMLAIVGSVLTTKEEQIHRGLQMHDALAGIALAHASRADWDAIIYAGNMLEEFSRMGLIREADDIIRAGQEAIASVVARGSKSACRASELKAIYALSEAYLSVLPGITTTDTIQAEQRLQARAHQADRLPVKE